MAVRKYICTKCKREVLYIGYYDGVPGKVCDRCFCEAKGLQIFEGIVCYVRNGRSIKPTVLELFSDTEVDEILEAAYTVDSLVINLKRSNAAFNALNEFKTEISEQKSNNPLKNAEVDRRLRAFLLEWKMYTEHWKSYINGLDVAKYGQQYVDDFKDLYRKTMDAAFLDKEFILAHVLRNYISHRADAVDHAHIFDKPKFYTRKSSLVKFLNESITKTKSANTKSNYQSQLMMIQKCQDEIDLEDMANKAMNYLRKIEEPLMDYLVDTDMLKACQILMDAKKKIEESGIKGDIWYLMKLSSECCWEGRETYKEITLEAPFDNKSVVRIPYGHIDMNWEMFSAINLVVTKVWNMKQNPESS